MNTEFETNIKQIQIIIKKRIFIIHIMTLLFLLLAIFLTLFYSEFRTYIILIYIITAFSFLLQILLNQSNRKLNEMLKTYPTNQREIIDYLVILIKNAEYNQNNFIMSTYYKNIIVNYIRALESLKMD